MSAVSILYEDFRMSKSENSHWIEGICSYFQFSPLTFLGYLEITMEPPLLPSDPQLAHWQLLVLNLCQYKA